MLATLVIVFREVIEAALVLSIVAAATKGVAGRNRWLVLGVAGGLAGAALVAAFAGTIAGMLEGSGQEVFNASVLFVAVAMLGWHNVWMNSHGRELAAEMKAVGHDVAVGTRPLYAVAIVVGMAVLREGSEVVLFLYGIASGGVGASGLLIGGAVGVVAGAALGFALYFGLLNLSTRRLFSVTSWLILLLAAGMAAQGANYLVQANILPSLGRSIWDTSWLLTEQNIFGQLLHTLIGYTARPSGIQLVFYVGTLVVIGGAMKIYGGASRRAAGGIAACLLCGFAIAVSAPGGKAEAGEFKVYSPYVEKGEVETEYQGYRTFDGDSSKDNEQAHKVGLGYGVTDYWSTEFSGAWKKDASGTTHFDATEWENIFQLTDQGRYFADFGLLVEYEHVRDRAGDADELAFGPLIAKEIGQTTNTINVILERQLGAHAEGGLGLTYRLQSRWRLDPLFEPAVEAYGEFGRINNFDPHDEQRHMVGPAVQGAIDHLGPLPGKLRYDVGYLFGVTSGTPDGTLKTVLEYELFI